MCVTVLAVALTTGAGAAHWLGSSQRQASVASARPARAGTPSSALTAAGDPGDSTDSTRATPTVPAGPQPAPRLSTGATKQLDPGSWSSRQLAAELVMTGATMGDAAAIKQAAEKGVGGVVLFGPSSPNLPRTLDDAKAAAPMGNAPLIASDEEGGQVQRLSSLIYPLPSAETMGHWDPSRITETARRYALKMRALGVTMALGPVADLAIPGYFIAAAQRSFSQDPRQVGLDVSAWDDGLRRAGVLGVVKHWPGHGQASDTHVGGSTVPAWQILQGRDLIPFNAALAHHADAVMVGHLRVPGLTEGLLPASESPTAIRALRALAGGTALIMTDDLSMAAASTTLGITPAQAAVRSLVAGSDVAMVCWVPAEVVISAVAKGIDDGQLPRAQAVASARRVLRLKLAVSTSG
jgi:beta-N-acetylhexosaminidase